MLLWKGHAIRPEAPAVLVPPRTEQEVRFVYRESGSEVRVRTCTGVTNCRAKGDSITFKAPGSGNHVISLKLWIKTRIPGMAPDTLVGRKLKLHVLSGFPSSLLEHGRLNGFELGEYPEPEETARPELYKPPEHFYYLDEKVRDCFISKHVKLSDVGHDVRAGMPQYFALDYDLVVALEEMISELERLELPSRVHYIGGGFISPRSNQVRCGKVSAAAPLSRHMWGEAVDFIIDEDPQDGIMDDMNGDGTIDVRDAFFLRDLLSRLAKEGRIKPGGIGVYSPPRNHQVQLHLDVRGIPARWGYEEYDPEVFSGVAPKKGLQVGG
ncbi:MAG: hypothetical protein R6V10_01290 [bacterium]